MERPYRLLIKNADWILTMDEQGTRYRHGDILIEDSRIAEVGRNLILEEPLDEIVDARGFIIIPGMVNTHHHCAHTIVRNLPHAFEMPLMKTLKLIYARLPHFTHKSIYAATLGGLGDLLKTGCTTSCDQHYAFPQGQDKMIDVQVTAARNLGIRFQAIRGSLSTGAEGGVSHVLPSLVEPLDKIVKDSVRLIEKYHDPSEGSMLRVGISPCWLVYEDRRVVEESRKIAEHYDVNLHSHLADSREEFSFCKERYGCTPVEYADKMGYLQQRSFFAHCVQVTRSDIALLAKSKVGVSSCPNSDMLLNSSVSRISELFRRGINVSIGVDGAASNNASSMISEVKNAFLIQKFIDRETSITPEKILYMATAGGAKVLGRSDIGSLEEGKMADFVMLNWNKFQYAGGKYDPVSAIVLSGDPRMVENVFVHGKKVVSGGRLTQIDEDEANEFINRQTRLMIQRFQDEG